jgi:hypothetical protein
VTRSQNYYPLEPPKVSSVSFKQKLILEPKEPKASTTKSPSSELPDGTESYPSSISGCLEYGTGRSPSANIKTFLIKLELGLWIHLIVILQVLATEFKSKTMKRWADGLLNAGAKSLSVKMKAHPGYRSET